MKRTEDEIKLQRIIERYEDDKEVAKYAGMGLTLEGYEILVKQAKQAQEMRREISRLKRNEEVRKKRIAQLESAIRRVVHE